MKRLFGFSLILCSLLAFLPVHASSTGFFQSHTSSSNDSVPGGFSLPLAWNAGLEVLPSYVLGTASWLKGENQWNKPIRSSVAADFNLTFRFSPESREGILYPGLYTGFGLGPTFFPGRQEMLSTPGSIYATQGAPFKHFSPRLSLGYEWQFGIAAGWNDNGGDFPDATAVISTVVTAHMGVRLKLKYAITDDFNLTMALCGTHFSNGNTSWRNSGLNSAGIAIGAEYALSSHPKVSFHDRALEEEADRKKWFIDFIGFGSWRKRTVEVPTPILNEEGEIVIEDAENLVPGRFPVAGIQVAPMITLNRWVAVGAALDLKWDKSAGKRPYWIEDTHYEQIRFNPVPFSKQIAAGISAHAELTTPLFSINAGVGVNIINPKGDKYFYQQLIFKAFITRNLFLNIGYGLGNFKNPNNLMLGVGYRLY
ncbi:MAG: hypothetical protein K2J70_03770 [Muribaculaceae bacterium]|nr:hypothetical protein [Muribaculaceae bacterium]